jgi:hypothetical protein
MPKSGDQRFKTVGPSSPKLKKDFMLGNLGLVWPTEPEEEIQELEEPILSPSNTERRKSIKIGGVAFMN